uniref:Putative ovule protein n=1 Tax=Solanum chacoense TaxID=4108 RepID=A0A0V0GMU1_SOLCH
MKMMHCIFVTCLLLAFCFTQVGLDNTIVQYRKKRHAGLDCFFDAVDSNPTMKMQFTVMDWFDPDGSQ